jgi:hypothetical protein
VRVSPPVPVIITRGGQKVRLRHEQFVFTKKLAQTLVKFPIQIDFHNRINLEVALFAEAKDFLHRRMHRSGEEFAQFGTMLWERLAMPGMP